MKIPLFYSLATGRLRRCTVPSDEAESDRINLKPRDAKEGVLIISEKEYGEAFSEDGLQALITKATGLAPVIERYAVVTPIGDVVTAILADADAVIEGAELIKHAEATSGWKYQPINDTFVNLNAPDPPKPAPIDPVVPDGG